MSKLIFDIETIGDIRNHDDLKITVVSICDVEFDKYKSFEEHELGELWPILEKADCTIGYNSESFDIPILNKYYTGDLTKIPHIDILKIIRESTGKRFKLNDIAKATLQIEKSADGLQAQEWFREGKMDEIKKYCEQDVRVTKEIYLFGKKNRMLYYPSLTGALQPFAVNFDLPKTSEQTQAEQGSGFNLTLPF